jgi:hypothetical protein
MLRATVGHASYLERAEQALVNAHHRTSIVKFTTVIGRTEQRYELALREELITVLNDLVSTTNEVHIVLLQEARYDVWPKCEADTAVVLTPSGDVLVGIGPQEIAKEAAIGNLPLSATVPGSIHHFFLALLTSVGRMTRLICSIEFRSGLRPPCIVKIFSSMIAAMGKQLKQSVKVFHNLMLYLRLHSS